MPRSFLAGRVKPRKPATTSNSLLIGCVHTSDTTPIILAE
jgi:hypothetical protein